MKKKDILILGFLMLSLSVYAEVKCFVMDDHVRIRTAPSITYSKVIDTVNAGKILKVTGCTDYSEEIDGLVSPWYQVTFGETEFCWIYGGYVKLLNSAGEHIKTWSKGDANCNALWYWAKTDPIFTDCMSTLTQNDVLEYERKSDGIDYLTFMSGPYRITYYKLAEEQKEKYEFRNVTIVENFPDNPLGLNLIGLSLNDILTIVGRNNYYGVEFHFDESNIVKEIEIYSWNQKPNGEVMQSR